MFRANKSALAALALSAAFLLVRQAAGSIMAAACRFRSGWANKSINAVLGTQFKLRAGTYVLAAGSVNWASFRFAPGVAGGPLVDHKTNRPSTIQYVVMSTARA